MAAKKSTPKAPPEAPPKLAVNKQLTTECIAARLQKTAGFLRDISAMLYEEADHHGDTGQVATGREILLSEHADQIESMGTDLAAIQKQEQ